MDNSFGCSEFAEDASDSIKVGDFFLNALKTTLFEVIHVSSQGYLLSSHSKEVYFSRKQFPASWVATNSTEAYKLLKKKRLQTISEELATLEAALDMTVAKIKHIESEIASKEREIAILTEEQ